MSVALAAVGAAVGSFLNVVVHRLPLGQSLVAPRSACPECKTPIAPYDNVPVFSWLALRGRCRHCEARISARYPVLELLTAVAFAAVALTRGMGLELILLLPFAAVLIAVAAIDLDHRIVPNRILVPTAVLGLAGGLAIHPAQMPEQLLAGAGAFTFLLLAALAYPAGMGMGDVKLAGVMGLFLGLSVVPALFIAFLAGTLVGVVALAREGAAARKKALPFAPFLALGGLASILAGPELIELYSRTFLG